MRVSVRLKNYGIPYMGSKSGICDQIMKALPSAENFYDLFGGGFAITHAAIVAKKYKNYFFNEIEASTVELIKKAISGEFSYTRFKPKFISREEFFEKKDKDAYVGIIWSFGNNQKNYLFSKEIEQQKKSLHNAVVFDEFDSFSEETLGFNCWPKNIKHLKNKRLLCRQIIVSKRNSKQLERLQQLEKLQQLQRLERLQRLQQLQQLESLQQLQHLEMSSLDYRELKIKPNSIVYCDPPYKNTAKYLREFDHDSFYKWAKESEHPIFISEYQMPKYFKKIASIEKGTTLSPNGKTQATEAIFVNESAADLLFGGKQK